MIHISEVFREIGLWVRYFCVWPGLPPRGNPAEADCILVQAFGRNHYDDDDLFMIADLRQRCGSDVLTLEALSNHSFEAGQPNKELAKECRAVMDGYPRLVALVQWEIAAAFDWQWYMQNVHRIVCVWPKSQDHFRTVEVKKASKLAMDLLGLSRPIEIAHKRQMVRAFLIVRKIFGQAPIVLKQQTCSFDSNSVQSWTKSWHSWFIRETLVRIHHLVKGHVV